MKILVLGGCGAMGTEATRDLLTTSDFSQIVVADQDLERAQKLCAELGGGRVSALAVDVTQKESLAPLFSSFDVVLNCTSYVFGLAITEAAIQARRPLLDLGGLYNTPKQLAMTERAQQAGVTIVLGMGATPGVTNLMARAASTHMDAVREIHIAFCTYRRIAPSPGLLDTVLDEFSPATVRFYYEAGEFVRVPAFAGEKEVTFAPPIGTVKTYYVPHSETHTLPRFIPGVQRVDVRGTWRPEIMTALRHYHEVGLLSMDPIPGPAGPLSPKAFLRSYYLARDDQQDPGEYFFFLNVEVAGTRSDCNVVATYTLSHPPRSEWGMTATARVTGVPASIGAQRLARGEGATGIRPGVLAPEAAFEPYGFFTDLSRRQIHVHEQIVETRNLG